MVILFLVIGIFELLIFTVTYLNSKNSLEVFELLYFQDKLPVIILGFFP